ncbi:hypothetical protein D3C87_332590 [compost metagenome]|jgi:hypothetical protein
MSENNTAATVITVGLLGLIGFKCYRNHKRRKEEEAKMVQVRATVANMIKDVPGYNKPSR